MPRRAELPNIQPARLDLTHYRGDTFSMRLRLQSQGVPINVSTWIFESHIRQSIDGEQIAHFTCFTDTANGADGLQGIIRLVLPSAAAQLLPATCIWDLQADITETDPNDSSRTNVTVRTVLRGQIYTPGDVTYQDNYSARSTALIVGG